MPVNADKQRGLDTETNGTSKQKIQQIIKKGKGDWHGYEKNKMDRPDRE